MALAQRIKGRFFIPFYVPKFLLRWLMGEMSIEVLKSAFISAVKIKKTGFQFLYPSLDSALDQLAGKLR